MLKMVSMKALSSTTQIKKVNVAVVNHLQSKTTSPSFLFIKTVCSALF